MGCGHNRHMVFWESEWNCFRTSLFNEDDPQVRFVLAGGPYLWRGQVLNAQPSYANGFFFQNGRVVHCNAAV